MAASAPNPTLTSGKQDQLSLAGTSDDQRLAVQREQARRKAVEASKRTRRQSRDSRIWQDVHAAIRRNHCTCPLRSGMTLEDLRPLGSGCAERWTCSALDLYRRLLR